MYTRPFVENLLQSINKAPQMIQVILEPRQVGKTTDVQQLFKKDKKEQFIYTTADGDIHRPSSWILEQWLRAEFEAKNITLVIDEIQKVDQWSETVKKLWDQQRQNRPKNFIRLILLGSSSLDLQKGLNESLAGRFLLHKILHWDFVESATHRH